MAWLAVNKDLKEAIFNLKPGRGNDLWCPYYERDSYIMMPKGSIKKLIGRDLTWNDEPVEFKED